jgi:hypothetical protein
MRPLGVSLHWEYFTLILKQPKNAFGLKLIQNYFLKKIKLKTVADIVFDLRNDFDREIG